MTGSPTCRTSQWEKKGEGLFCLSPFFSTFLPIILSGQCKFQLPAPICFSLYLSIPVSPTQWPQSLKGRVIPISSSPYLLIWFCVFRSPHLPNSLFCFLQSAIPAYRPRSRAINRPRAGQAGAFRNMEFKISPHLLIFPHSLIRSAQSIGF